MTSWCAADDAFTWPTCDPAPAIAADADPYKIAAAIQLAAVTILNTDCHTDGGVTWGTPTDPGDCCCGQIQTGIVTPIDFGTPCFTTADYTFLLRVTWNAASHTVAVAAEEAHRLNRLLADHVCCLLVGDIWAKNDAHIVAADNTHIAGECPQFTLTVKVT